MGALKLNVTANFSCHLTLSNNAVTASCYSRVLVTLKKSFYEKQKLRCDIPGNNKLKLTFSQSWIQDISFHHGNLNCKWYVILSILWLWESKILARCKWFLHLALKRNSPQYWQQQLKWEQIQREPQYFPIWVIERHMVLLRFWDWYGVILYWP